jgi:hypothetical protein
MTLGRTCSVMSVRSCLVHMDERALEVATLVASEALVEYCIP